MFYNIEIIENHNFKTSIWSGGKTTELSIFPKNSIYKNLDFKWRLSSATVELEHSIFTTLPNIERYICTLDENLIIKHNHDDNAIKLAPFEIHKFKGDWHTESFGKVTDFNLMLGNGCTGVLNALFLDDTLTFSSSCNDNNASHVTEGFFCPYSSFSISINKEKAWTINKNTLVLITIPKPYKIDIALNSSTKTKVLRATIMV